MTGNFVKNGSFEALGSLLMTSADSQADLVLPNFGGTSKRIGNNEFTYPGEVYTDRDTKSAFYISNLLTKFIDLHKINLKDTEDFNFNINSSELVFIFGSKSNEVTQRLLDNYEVSNNFSMSFGETWTIHSNGSGENYSIINPSTLSRTEYENTTDYGVIARFTQVSKPGKTTFVIAGLGSRATEGCGLYFASNWELLNAKFGDQNVAAVILKFAPPVTPQNYEVQEWLV
ncbi:hypothetical protein [Spirosoma foliorum]|uniref:Uncharacterized protein n=1 Tax=Spirosoma foliorum TaxID=2710596 RepID=A0A7G5GRJ9_9BACT|nr:hypothetical protein [Spirosoma foliorum]QMW01491.1 hypothetical protein H3H32_26545 [Spirosoma foliorum]